MSEHPTDAHFLFTFVFKQALKRAGEHLYRHPPALPFITMRRNFSLGQLIYKKIEVEKPRFLLP